MIFPFFHGHAGAHQAAQEQALRNPLLYGANANDIPENTQRVFNGTSMTELGNIAAHMHSDADAPAVPDIFMRDFSLAENIENIEAGDQGAFDEWFGFFCALLLSKPGVIQTITYRRGDLVNENEHNLFKRALGAEMTARSIEELTVYKVVNVMIGYAYAGMKTLICPAADIQADLRGVFLPECIMQNDESGYRFTNPIDTLTKQMYASKAKYVALELSARRQDLAHQNRLCRKLDEIIEKLKNGIPGEELEPFRAENDIRIPGTPAAPTELSPMAQRLSSWLEKDIVVFPPREDRNQFKGCHGVFDVKKDENNNEMNEQAIVPFNQSFAQEISSMRFGSDGRQTEADDWITWLDRPRDERQEVQQHIWITSCEEQAYRIDIEYNGNRYCKYYDADHIIKSQSETLHMPVVAVWPKTRDTDRKWRDYYLYVRNLENEGVATTEGLVLTALEPGEHGELTSRRPGFDRKDAESRIHDEVTHTHDFPQFIQVSYQKDNQNRNVGVLFPMSQGSMTKPATQSCVIAIDFGSTNTIAYKKMQNNLPEPLTVGNTASVICERGDGANMADRTDMTLDFFNPESWDNALFLTMLKIHGPHDEHLPEVLPLEEGSIPFTDTITITPSMQSRLITDELKWNRQLDANPNPAQIQRTRGYLKTIIMMYKWSAYQNGAALQDIQWRFAYPRSMSQDAREALVQVFEDYIQPDHLASTSEANAAGSFLQDPALAGLMQQHGYNPLQMKDPCMLIDIGGGTVDYSLWQENKLVTEASMIGVAGDFALRSAIMHDDQMGVEPDVDFLRGLFPLNNENGIKQIKEQLKKQLVNHNDELIAGELAEKLIAYMEVRRDPEYGAYASTINNMFKQLWTTNINEICGRMQAVLPNLTARTAVKQYAKRLKMYYICLFYFAGELVGAAMNEGKMTVTSCFNIGLIGNGAKSVLNLENLTNGSFANSRMNDMLKRAFTAGVKSTFGQEPNMTVQIIEPIKAKHEVAMGLCMKDNITVEETESVLTWMTDENNNAELNGLIEHLRNERGICRENEQEQLIRKAQVAFASTADMISRNHGVNVWRRKDTVMAEIMKNMLR